MSTESGELGEQGMSDLRLGSLTTRTQTSRQIFTKSCLKQTKKFLLGSIVFSATPPTITTDRAPVEKVVSHQPITDEITTDRRAELDQAATQIGVRSLMDLEVLPTDTTTTTMMTEMTSIKEEMEEEEEFGQKVMVQDQVTTRPVPVPLLGEEVIIFVAQPESGDLSTSEVNDIGGDILGL